MSGEDRKRYVITYDIADDGLRNRVATLLQGAGLRVQRSVFECILDNGELDRLAAGLGRLVAGHEGADLRIYRLCASCFAASFGLGEVEEGAGREPWIVA